MSESLREEAWGRVMKSIPITGGVLEIRQGKSGRFSAFQVVGNISLYQCVGNRCESAAEAERMGLKASEPTVHDQASTAWQMNKQMWRGEA